MNNAWLDIPSADRAQILEQISVRKGLNSVSIEKDWWVTMCLVALFRQECSESLIFKGGTSLSKCWHLIERFSEDIDVAIDRNFFGLGGEITRRKDITNIRLALCDYALNHVVPMLQVELNRMGIFDFEIVTPNTDDSSIDPQIIEVHYQSAVPSSLDYISSKVVIEIGARSMFEPFEKVQLQSFIAEEYPTMPYADIPVTINVATPERTFLEKIFLIHEELQKPTVRIARMSRHLYDIVMMKDNDFANTALHDKVLYESIVAHRNTLTHINGLDYSLHAPETINIIPPTDSIGLWKDDYQNMMRSMIYGKQINFDELLSELKNLQEIIHQIRF